MFQATGEWMQRYGDRMEAVNFLGIAPVPDRTRAGRRAGNSGTREAILEAARRQFAELGYDRTSLRRIAQEAEIDAALVSHFYGSKQRLFLAVVELPFEPREILPSVVAGERAEAGANLARFILGVLETTEGRRRLTGLVRAAASEPEAASLVRELITREFFAPIVAELEVDDAPLRAALVGSQMVGLVMARYVVAVEPLASADAETVAAAIGPVLQHYLTEPLG